MRVICLIWLAMLVGAPAAWADEAPQTDTSAFEKADAMSFYTFDGCGDALGGR